MTPDKFGNVYLVDRDTGLDHGPCTVAVAKEILAQENNLATDGGHRYVDKDEWDGKVAGEPVKETPKTEQVEAPKPEPVKETPKTEQVDKAKGLG